MDIFNFVERKIVSVYVSSQIGLEETALGLSDTASAALKNSMMW